MDYDVFNTLRIYLYISQNVNLNKNFDISMFTGYLTFDEMACFCLKEVCKLNVIFYGS